MEESNVYLIGFMGAGKSTVAPELADELDREWVDTDDLIEDEAGLSIPEIFEYYGENRFREIETKIIRKVSQEGEKVVAVGGGAPMEEENWKRLKSTGQVVYLEVSPGEVMERIGNDGGRPLLADLNREEREDKVKQMLKDRHPRYVKADHVVLCDGVGTGTIAEEIVLKLNGKDGNG
ncbi:MAG: shikimate kinase [Candidatus Acetothermia bacterium]